MAESFLEQMGNAKEYLKDLRFVRTDPDNGQITVEWPINKKGDRTSAFATAEVVLGLLHAGIDSSDEIIEGSVKHIEDFWKEDEEKRGKGCPIYTKESPVLTDATSISLLALSKIKEKEINVDEEIVKKISKSGVDWLLDKDDKGFRKFSGLKKKSIMSTCFALRALLSLKNLDILDEKKEDRLRT